MAAESPIDFGDLLAHDVPIEWHEAVAVIQEVCAKLFGARAVAPDPAHVVLHPFGTIELLTEAPSSEPAAQRLGYTLNALLQGTSPPAELRLFTSQAISGAAAASIDEFTQRLAYFERPGRSRVLQQLYERAALDLATARARQERQHGNGADVVGTTSNIKTAGAVARIRRWTRAGIAVVGVAIVSTLIIWGGPRLRVGYRRSPAAGVVTKTGAAVGSLIASGVSSGRSLLSKAGLIDTRESVAQPDAKIHRELRVRPERRHTEPAKASGADSGEARPTTPIEPATPSGSSTPIAPAAIAEQPLAPDLTVYTADDSGVAPPRLVWPQFTRTGTARSEGDSAVTRPGEVDLLVDETGAVEHVKFLNKPERLRQSMLLSAMKAWRYHPALKAGHPVRYLVRVTLPF